MAKLRSQRLTQQDADRLLRRYLANGVRLTANATGTSLGFAFHGMGAVMIEATEDGLVIHEPVQEKEATA